MLYVTYTNLTGDRLTTHAQDIIDLYENDITSLSDVHLRYEHAFPDVESETVRAVAAMLESCQ